MKINSFADMRPVDLDQLPRPDTQERTKSFAPKDPLQDSMEEVAMKFSESVERNSKKLDERQVRESRSSQRIERIEKLTEMYSLLDNGEQPSLEQQARRMQLQMMQPGSSLPDLLNMADNDPARADILLQQVARMSAAEGREAEHEHAQTLLDELRLSHGDKIRAGFNTASAIALFSSDPQQRSLMRQLYYKAIVGQQPLASLLEALLERFNEDQFSRGLRTLQRALADDIAALAPSLPGGVLRSMLRGLGASGQLNNLLKTCLALLERLAKKSPDSSMTALGMSKRILRFCGNGFFARDLTLLAEETMGRTPNLLPLFFNGLYPLLQSLPLALWKDLKTRQNGLRLLQGLMDELSLQERKVMGLDDGGRIIQ